MTDNDGNVTGIIDWEGAFLAPRCMGASAVPKFLNRDWFPQKVGGLYSFPNLIWRSYEYRGIYAAAMIEESLVTEHPDALLISNSAIYTPALSGVLGLIGGGNPEDFVSKLIQSIPRLHRVPEKEYFVEVGRGLPDEECLLKQEIAAILEPRLPDEKSFQHFRLVKEELSAQSTALPLDSEDGPEPSSDVSLKCPLPTEDTSSLDNVTNFEPTAELDKPTSSDQSKEEG